jgi:hypothetical protein
MKIGVIGNGLTATFIISLLMKEGYTLVHYVDPIKVPHSWASAGIVHPFNFKTATWKKFGYDSFLNFLQFLETWNLKPFFHFTGLFYVCQEKNLWNDWFALSNRFPDFIQVKEKGIFFPQSGWLQVKKIWDILNNQFLKHSNYQRICEKVNPKQNKNCDIWIEAGGIDSLKNYPNLPLYPKNGFIHKIFVNVPLVSFIYWKHFFLIPTNNPSEYWVGPEKESLQYFEQTFPIEYQILKTISGIKPYSLLGRAFCFKQNNILFLNGVGGRGILEGLRISHEALKILQNIS